MTVTDWLGGRDPNQTPTPQPLTPNPQPQPQPQARALTLARFGGRGHDFDRLDERANAEGGMLVIATSIPDAREWAQWKWRTARQVITFVV